MSVLRRVVLGTSVAVLVALGVAQPASAALPPGQLGSFATYTVSGGAGAWTGTGVFPASTGIPSLAITSTAATVRVPSGETAFLGASTGFGQHFGSTRSQQYLTISPATGGGPSSTTFTWTAAPPAGWGFAVGDIDADYVTVTPLGADGNALPVQVQPDGAPLGKAIITDAALLNYCTNVPKPSTCGAGSAFTDVPVWGLTDPFTLTSGSVTGTYPFGTVVGRSGADTAGSYDYFIPTSPDVRGIRLDYGVLTGIPTFQLWIAAPTPSTVITGVVRPADATGPLPPGGTVEVENLDGTPVLDVEEQPIVVPIEADGTFTLPPIEQAEYLLDIIPPPGYQPIEDVPVSATATEVDLGELLVQPVPPPAPTPSATPTPTPRPALAESGVDPLATALPAVAVVAVGAVALAWASGRGQRMSPARVRRSGLR